MIFGEGERRRTIRTSSENLTKSTEIAAFWQGSFYSCLAWQFSSYLIQHGCKIVEVNNSDNFLNYKNLPLLTEPSDKIIIRAMEEGRTNYVPHVINGNNYKIVVMGNKQYIPDVTAQQ